jgi:iron transport multicopper oxidase
MLLLILLIGLLNSELIEYTLNIEYKWMTINDFRKAVICVNGLNVGPVLRAKQNDVLRINVSNNLFTESISVHWHGIKQKNTPWMDGTPYISECPIQVGTNKIYEFAVPDFGTFFYHSHIEMQMKDSFFGALIVEDINHNTKITYDEEYIIIFSDFHKQDSEELIQMLKSVPFEWTGSPYRLLANGMTNFNMSVSYGKTYLIRFISAVAHSYLNISIPGHNVSIVEVEGTYTDPLNISHIWLNEGQRYTVLLTANNIGCYYINVSSMSDPINVLIGLIYDNIDCNHSNYISTINNNFFNTSLLTNKYHVDLPKPNKNLSLVMTVKRIHGTGKLFVYNNNSFTFPTVPILLSYYLGTYVPNNETTIINVELNDVIDIELINNSPFQHTYHMHHVSFYVLNSDKPVIRDVVTIEKHERITIRVVFDNPSITLAHCHSVFHLTQQLVIVFAYPANIIPRPPSNFIICGKTFGEIKQRQKLINTIYSLGATIVLMLIAAVITLIVIYKKKRLEEERMRLIV